MHPLYILSKVWVALSPCFTEVLRAVWGISNVKKVYLTLLASLASQTNATGDTCVTCVHRVRCSLRPLPCDWEVGVWDIVQALTRPSNAVLKYYRNLKAPQGKYEYMRPSATSSKLSQAFRRRPLSPNDSSRTAAVHMFQFASRGPWASRRKQRPTCRIAWDPPSNRSRAINPSLTSF